MAYTVLWTAIYWFIIDVDTQAAAHITYIAAIWKADASSVLVDWLIEDLSTWLAGSVSGWLVG